MAHPQGMSLVPCDRPRGEKREVWGLKATCFSSEAQGAAAILFSCQGVMPFSKTSPLSPAFSERNEHRNVFSVLSIVLSGQGTGVRWPLD